MKMHKIDYKVLRTGSRLFDDMMVSAAQRICSELPGIQYEVTAKEIRVFGELDDAAYGQYEIFMFGEDQTPAEKPEEPVGK